MAARI